MITDTGSGARFGSGIGSGVGRGCDQEAFIPILVF